MRIQAPSLTDHSLNVDEGEKEAISLAREVKAAAILMDDRKGRAMAVRCGLKVTGTIGLLEAAACRSLIDFTSVIDKLRRTNSRIDEKVLQAALARIRLK